MTLALLQPTFAPNLYDLAVMMQADHVVLEEQTTWSRKGRVHRAMIRTPEGSQYIHIPIRAEDRGKPIHQVRIDQRRDWVAPILDAFSYNYRNSRYYDHYEPEIRADFGGGREEEYLLSFSLHLRRRLFRFLELDLAAKETLSGRLEGYVPEPDRLARTLGAEVLFQEHGSRHYQRQASQRREPKFEHPVYRQHFDGFIPWCSLYDLLFQYGPESFRITDPLGLL